MIFLDWNLLTLTGPILTFPEPSPLYITNIRIHSPNIRIHTPNIKIAYRFNKSILQPGAVAQSDAHPPGMQAVAGLILTSGNILSWRLVMK